MELMINDAWKVIFHCLEVKYFIIIKWLRNNKFHET